VAGLISLSRSIPKLLQSHQGYKPSDYRRSISRFTEAFSNTFHSSTKLGSKESPFPMIKVLKDEIALICFDSNDVYPTVRKSVGGILKEFTMNGIYWITAAQNLSENPVCCNGWIEKGGLKKVLSDPILKGKKKIVLTHHYLYDLETVMAYQNTAFSNFMQMYPSSLNYFVSQLEKKDIDLVLHGHWHITESYRCGSLQVLNSGGSLSNANRNYRGWFLITTGAGKPIAKRINVA
jgi:3',5'-cyclic AMP phosphodiesterase CpdA